MKPFRGIMLDNSHPLARGLVGLWLLNEGAGKKAYDLSGNRNHGSLIADTHFIAGKFGSALDFDGAGDYVTSPASIAGLQKASASIWVKPSALGSAQHIFNQRTGTINWQVFIRADGTVRLRIDTAGGSTNLDSLASCVALEWCLVTWTYDDPVMKIYINGVESNSANHSSGGAILNNSLPFILGTTIGSSQFTGKMDNCQLYNRTLKASETRELFINPFSVFLENTVIPFVGVTPTASPNLTSKNNYNGYLAFIQQYIKHKINGTDPWANPQGDLL